MTWLLAAGWAAAAGLAAAALALARRAGRLEARAEAAEAALHRARRGLAIDEQVGRLDDAALDERLRRSGL